MKPSELTALIARVEAATRADLELDALILCEVAAPKGSFVERSKINGAWCIYEEPSRLWEMSSRNGWHRSEGWGLTSSLDAALSLLERVLPGSHWRLWRSETAKAYAADVGDNDTCYAPTPALALVLATLKALHSAQLARSEGQ